MPEDAERTARILAHLAIPGNESKSHTEIGRELGVPDFAVRRARQRQDRTVTTTIELPIAAIRTDGTQQRTGLDPATLARYRERWRDGLGFDADPVVFEGPDGYCCGDGGHRIESARLEGLASIRCDVRTGTHRDAVLYSCGANAGHGKPREPEDTRKAVATLLADPEWGRWPDGRIAEACRCSATTVRRLRASILASGEDGSTRVVTRNGTTYEQKLPGRKPKAEDDGITRHDPEAEAKARAGDDEWHADDRASLPPASSPGDDDGLAPRVMGDDEYLEHFKLRPRLADHCRALFDGEVLLHRHLTQIPEWKSFSPKLKALLDLKASGKRRGPMFHRLRRLVATDPAKWTQCPKCDGQGTAGPVDCQVCYGAGYRIN